MFGALRKSDFEQPFLPAREQFNGTGSYGNGGESLWASSDTGLASAGYYWIVDTE